MARKAGGAPSFAPNKLVKETQMFGQVNADLTSLAIEGVSRHDLLAAQMQHRICNFIREDMLAQGMLKKDLAAELNIETQRFYKISRGELWLPLIEMLRIAESNEAAGEYLVQQMRKIAMKAYVPRPGQKPGNAATE